MVGDGIALLLEDKVEVIGIARDGNELVEMASELQPDVIVTDISMQTMNGLDAIRILKRRGNRAKIIILTMHQETALAAEAFHSGAVGFLTKQTACTELLTAIQNVLSGKKFLTSRLNASAVDEYLTHQQKQKDAPTSPLSERQKEIVILTAEGKSMKEIGELLCISSKTVETHKYKLMKLLGLTSNAQLIRYAIRSGLVQETSYVETAGLKHGLTAE